MSAKAASTRPSANPIPWQDEAEFYRPRRKLDAETASRL